jgi:parallel beta-helix repeat protein
MKNFIKMKKSKILLIFFFVFFILNNQDFNPLCRADGANTFFVGGINEGNYTRIQDAVDNSSKNDTVFVYSGYYTESIILNKSINLIGESKESVILKNYHQIFSIYIRAPWINISNFKIQDSEIGIYISNLGNGYVNISDNVFKNNNEAIRIYNSSYIQISDNIIENNSEFGIVISETIENEIIRNNITQNFKGIYLDRWSNSNRISNNNCSDNVYGVSVKFSFFNKIKNNDFFNNVCALYLTNSKNNSITNNTIEYSANSGILLENSDDNLLEPNFFNENSIDIKEKPQPPRVKAPGFELIFFMIGILLILYFRKNQV